jgi:hypothetical protein
VDKAEASLHRVVYENEAPLRVLLAHAIGRGASKGGVPHRQNRRRQLIDAALGPARHRLDDADYERLCAALALIFGPESMIVFRDVLRVDERTARAVKSWAARVLVRAAFGTSDPGPPRAEKKAVETR